MSKEKELVVKVQEELVQEGRATTTLEKNIPHFVEYVPRLAYTSRLKKDYANMEFKCFLGLLNQLGLYGEIE